jgi:hypothetical protein
LPVRFRCRNRNPRSSRSAFSRRFYRRSERQGLRVFPAAFTADAATDGYSSEKLREPIAGFACLFRQWPDPGHTIRGTTVPRKKRTSDLAALYSRFLAQQSQESRERCATVNRDRARKLGRLQRQGVITVADLLGRLTCLSPGLKQFGIELITLLKIQQAIPILLDLIFDRTVRMSCAVALEFLKPDRRVTQFFLRISNRELASASPDRNWLEAAVYGLRFCNDRRAVELLVTIFERFDLPGWLRGDAADKLGCADIICDRRTRLFQRCRDAALRGLDDESIEVQFGSMYVIGSLCSDGTRRRRSTLTGCEAALPRLHQIAANDQRLSPGYWWPMSAEAEDVINCIRVGCWPNPDAGDRWLGNPARGEWNRD